MPTWRGAHLKKVLRDNLTFTLYHLNIIIQFQALSFLQVYWQTMRAFLISPTCALCTFCHFLFDLIAVIFGDQDVMISDKDPLLK
jgi:hypothetical protein